MLTFLRTGEIVETGALCLVGAASIGLICKVGSRKIASFLSLLLCQYTEIQKLRPLRLCHTKGTRA